MSRAETPSIKSQFEKAGMYYESLRLNRPATKDDLKNYIKEFLGIVVPDKRICPEHSSPMDYLRYSFNRDFNVLTAKTAENAENKLKITSANSACSAVKFSKPANADCVVWANRGRGPSTGSGQINPALHTASQATNSDCVVWANRGGGKTELAAVATLLDCIFRPNCQVRILAGSEDQAGRMYQYLTGFLRNGFDIFLAGRIRRTGCRFANGSAVDCLTQSQASVRGQHIQKLRCDEVELFDNDVFNAAKFATQSTDNIIAGMETISTMHKPYGLMQKIVSNAAKTNTPVFKWCLWETIEKCTDRNCSQCPLWADCAGRAKEAAGYLKIDDCITQMRRSSRAAWEAEMLCMRPNLENVVFDQFDMATHIRAVEYDANLPLYRTLDFGFTNPFVCLWIQVDSEGVVRVIDEYVRTRATIDVHAAELKARTWHGFPARGNTAKMAVPPVIATFCDPAGAGVNDVTGTGAVRELRSLGINVRYRRSNVAEGIEAIRRAIRDGEGKSRFVASPRCARLIEAMTCYHYPDTPTSKELPLKDGVYDHPIDALRYFFVNHAGNTAKLVSRQY